MGDSDSSLSSPPSTDDEMPVVVAPAKPAERAPKKSKKNSNILTFFKHRSPSPPPRKRPASPPHEPVPEDNPQIAFIVMFRSRFNEAFPRGAPSVGPQDIEQGVAEETPSPDVEGLLCALLGLVLNRKKPVEKGHYGRALEEAIQTQKSQWPRQWTSNPISGGRSFNTMTAVERILLLHTLTLWSLNQNEQVKAILLNSYKSRTTKDKLDTNIPLSVQPWGRDGDKRRYWLVEGQNDTHFRIYRESDPKLKNVQWYSVAGSIDELRVLAKKLDEEDGHKDAKALGERMINAIPRFEASENKRKRREYRVNRNAAFSRPDPGFSLYEGRTRGKRLRYTFTDEEDFDSDNYSTRRSGRQSARETSMVPSGPTVTASGRQVRSRATGAYGETLHSGQVTDRPSPATGDYDLSDEPQQNTRGRSTRTANRGATNGHVKRTLDSDEEDDATSWDGGDEDEDEPDQMDIEDDEEEASDVSDEEEKEPQTLMVTLRYGKGASSSTNGTAQTAPVHPPASVNGAEQQHVYPLGAPLAGTGAPRQPEVAALPVASTAPVQAPTLPPIHVALQQQPPPVPAAVPAQFPNGLSALPQQPYSAPIAPVVQQPLPAINSQPNAFISAPTPTYNATEEASKVLPQPQTAQVPQINQENKHPAQQTLPGIQAPTPASSWQ
ncbi:hypothetical protein IQ07DRAFT_679646 [Pyrenochaeta sp. DS3sAY3a]|nr:hypothetical protein IQ07DRAFT_679646 [Pyrenochaeta sp. DS3sAY3a]